MHTTAMCVPPMHNKKKNRSADKLSRKLYVVQELFIPPSYQKTMPLE